MAALPAGSEPNAWVGALPLHLSVLQTMAWALRIPAIPPARCAFRRDRPTACHTSSRRRSFLNGLARKRAMRDWQLGGTFSVTDHLRAALLSRMSLSAIGCSSQYQPTTTSIAGIRWAGSLVGNGGPIQLPSQKSLQRSCTQTALTQCPGLNHPVSFISLFSDAWWSSCVRAVALPAWLRAGGGVHLHY